MSKAIVFSYESSFRSWNGDELWVLTPDGARPLSSTYPTGGRDITNRGVTLDNGLLVFNGYTQDSSPQLWVTDGTRRGTQPLNPELQLPGFKLSSNGDTAYFFATTPETGYELWATDGTANGTRIVKDINPGEGDGRNSFSTAGPPDQQDIVAFQDGVLFFASDEDVFFPDPYYSDGTESGTVKLAEASDTLAVVVGETVDFEIRAVGPQNAYFTSTSDEHGSELWVTDGTPSGTRMVKDLRPGPLSGEPFHPALLDDRLFFASGGQVWTSDGTESGTRQITEDLKLVSDFTVVNGRMLFLADDTVHGRELWVTDGTSAGTRLLKDIWPGSEDGVWTVRGRTLVTTGDGERAVFVAQNELYGRELWVTDGTEAGTRLLADIRTSESSTASSSPEAFLQVDGLVYFNAFDTDAGHTLWVTDGTEGGTRMVADPNPMSAGSAIMPIGWVDLPEAPTPIDGTDTADLLEGTTGRDLLRGLDGDDVVGGDGILASYFGNGLANSVYRLYQATLDRAPDVGGHAAWAGRLFTGERTLLDVAEGFVRSPEFTATYSAGLSNEGFVTLLYNNVLNSEPDARGLARWMGELEGGASRAEVVLGFSESPQFRTETAAEANGFARQSAATAWSDDVYRLYQATLDRAPDMTGQTNWSNRLATGDRTLVEVAEGFVGSPEFTNTYSAGLSNEDFVRLLYRNVLNTDTPDAQGLARWTGELEGGASRAEVVLGFSQSPQFTAETAAPLKAWIRDQGVQDEIDGGTGTNLLAGGQFADVFVFEAGVAQTSTVTDLEAWDFIDFLDFGYSSAAQARAQMSQSDADVVFADGDVEVTFRNISLAQITDDMIIV